MGVSSHQAISSYLMQVEDVTLLISMVESCEEKTSLLQSIILTGLDLVAPIKTKTIHITEPPWINQRLKSLINKHQRDLSLGDQDKFH